MLLSGKLEHLDLAGNSFYIQVADVESVLAYLVYVKDDMGQSNLKAPDDPTKITPNKDQVAVKAKLDVNG
ncbi:hypothetical protein ACS0TY_015882 [Phlomoides rotata]